MYCILPKYDYQALQKMKYKKDNDVKGISFIYTECENKHLFDVEEVFCEECNKCHIIEKKTNYCVYCGSNHFISYRTNRVCVNCQIILEYTYCPECGAEGI